MLIDNNAIDKMIFFVKFIILLISVNYIEKIKEKCFVNCPSDY